MRLIRTFASCALIAWSATGASSCYTAATGQKPGTLEYTERAKAAYEEALQTFFDRDWERATSLFKELKRKYGQSQYARLSELRLADIAFEQDKLTEAVSSYKAFAQSHRSDADIPYARYRMAKAQYLQINDTLLLPPQEERDQATTLDAYKELSRFQDEYPDSKWSADVDYMLESVTGRLVRHELYVARFYLRADNFEAAAARVQYALRTYEKSPLEPEAMVLLGETYLKMKKKKDAREAFERVLAIYPDSPFTVPARSFLNFMSQSQASGHQP